MHPLVDVSGFDDTGLVPQTGLQHLADLDGYRGAADQPLLSQSGVAVVTGARLAVLG